MHANAVISTTTMVGNNINLHAPQFSILTFYQDVALFFLTFNASGLLPFWSALAFWFKFLATFISLLFLVAIIYVVIKHSEHRKKEQQKEMAERGASSLPWVSSGMKAAPAAFGSFGTAFESPFQGKGNTAAITSTSASNAPAASGPVSNTADGAVAGVPAGSTGAATASISDSKDDDSGPSVDDILNLARAGIPVKVNSANAQAAMQAKQVREAKWQRVADHSQSASENDWRLAILEADILLEELLEMKHAHGDSVSEKLKSMAEGDMPSIQKAWEAHLVRNRISHDGSDYFLSQREARRVVSLYETVLREGGYM